MSLRRWEREHERGATLVEFAFVLPLFVLLLFAIIDFGWLLAQNLDVKQGAREGVRLAIVNSCSGSGNACSQDIADEVCNRTNDLPDKDKEKVTFALSGEFATVTVRYPARSLTGMTSVFINGDLTSTVEMRTEQPPTWSSGVYSCS
jgi:TadE-like protein